MSHRHLRLVADNPAPTTEAELYAAYQAAHARWHQTKSEPERIAMRDTYNRWVSASLPPNEREAVFLPATGTWGFN